jgi:hypothetical protein
MNTSALENNDLAALQSESLCCGTNQDSSG